MSLTTSHFIPFPREMVWDWHTRKGAVARLTPPFIPLNPITQAERLADGTTIFSLPAGLKWVARHDLSGFFERVTLHRRLPHRPCEGPRKLAPRA